MIGPGIDVKSSLIAGLLYIRSDAAQDNCQSGIDVKSSLIAGLLYIRSDAVKDKLITPFRKTTHFCQILIQTALRATLGPSVPDPCTSIEYSDIQIDIYLRRRYGCAMVWSHPVTRPTLRRQKINARPIVSRLGHPPLLHL
jgi:hypothetical protein